MTGVCLSCSSENSCFVLELQHGFRWKEGEARNVHRGFVALFNLRLPLFLGSIVMRYIAHCYLQCRCGRRVFFSQF